MAEIYKIVSPSNKIYIGQSKNCEHRKIYYRTLNCKGQPKLYNSLKKYGWESHTFEIVESTDKPNEREIYWICYYNSVENGLNCSFGGEGGGNKSDQTKQKISQSNKGTIHPIEGRISTSNKLKGRKLPPEQVEKIRLAKTGKPNPKKGKPDGPKPGVSEAHKGRTSPNKDKGKPVALYNTLGEYLNTYPNYTTLALDLNINPETVRCHLVGKANTICNKQYKVKYVLGDG
jgi:group I intron endonuclease